MGSIKSLKLNQKGYILIGIPLLFETIFLLILSSLITSADRTALQEQHSKDLIAEVERIHILFMDAATNLVDSALNGNERDFTRFDQINTEILDQMNLLDMLTKDNRTQNEIAHRIRNVVTRGTAMLQESRANLEKSDNVSLLSLIPATRRQFQLVSNELMPEVRRMVELVQKELEANGAENAVKSRALVYIWVFIGFIINVALAVSLAVFFNRTATSRIAVLLDNTRRMATEQPLHLPLVGTDEFAELDTKFHDMAEAVAEAMNKERALTENAVDVICSLDKNLHFVKVNPASSKLWGVTPEQLVGQPLSMLVAQEDQKATFGIVEQLINSQSAGTFECKIVRYSGQTCIENPLGQPKSRQKPIEATIEKPSKYESAIKHQLATEHIVEDNIGKDKVVLNRVVAEDIVAEGIVAQNIVEMAWSVAWSSTEQALFCVAHDITERKELERLKQSFYDMVSHDLRSPLSAIAHASEMLLEGIYGALSQEATKPVKTISRSSNRLISLINDLLDMQKMESGRMELQYEDVSVAEIIQQSIDSVRPLAEKANVSIVAKRSNLDVYADGNRLVQVLVNLLSNAIKFSPAGSAIDITFLDKPEAIEFRVSDKGPGIPMQYQQEIFERFKQLPSGKVKNSSGLGLAICKAIIIEHKGAIGVESEEGKGSTFWFRIPSGENILEEEQASARSI